MLRFEDDFANNNMRVGDTKFARENVFTKYHARIDGPKNLTAISMKHNESALHDVFGLKERKIWTYRRQVSTIYFPIYLP